MQGCYLRKNRCWLKSDPYQVQKEKFLLEIDQRINVQEILSSFGDP